MCSPGSSTRPAPVPAAADESSSDAVACGLELLESAVVELEAAVLESELELELVPVPVPEAQQLHARVVVPGFGSQPQNQPGTVGTCNFASRKHRQSGRFERPFSAMCALYTQRHSHRPEHFAFRVFHVVAAAAAAR